MGKYGIQNTPKEVMVLMASNVRAIRKEKKITQKDLSDRSGVAYATVKKFEITGQVSLESLLKICKALDRLGEFDALLQPERVEHKNKLFDI